MFVRLLMKAALLLFIVAGIAHGFDNGTVRLAQPQLQLCVVPAIDFQNAEDFLENARYQRD